MGESMRMDVWCGDGVVGIMLELIMESGLLVMVVGR